MNTIFGSTKQMMDSLGLPPLKSNNTSGGLSVAEAYSELCQTSKIVLFVKIVNGFQLSTIFKLFLQNALS